MKVILFGGSNSSFRGARALARANPESRAVAKCLDSGSTRRRVSRNDGITQDKPMDARNVIKLGMSAERTFKVTPDLTVRHILPTMPAVFATPMMILEMELTSGDAINAYLEPGWITVGTEVDIRHLAASAVGAVIRTTARVIVVARRVIRFEVEAFDGERRIGEGRHARGLVNLATFNKRFGTG